ncbi:MAG: TIGR04282 family arsenosugar biosynthesis glycosyltransferase [Inhella sp.]|jgi:rSAM/selenodomain-associated transferase 1|uniref:TIGR04282 family arsenosugar biosynthesis glycosyltransferase n=1 Tax=Inhella sp. TaxID=1921806 RepID=UPI0022C847E2|nr:TIGR04282 family arsenosugar biosynthesis glycosyltransferase [Inhella sp.]MCZ8233977.1 TIGR04282 family arsenosugar biosynthesis glycosyltransferase [Inhella sp.]
MIAACLTVLAKAPVAGMAKTRLIPALGADGAARLAARLLDHTMAEAAATGFAHLRLLGSPDAQHPALARHAGVAALGSQCEGDLGARMLLALRDGLASQPASLIIGTDAPALDRHRLREAALVLEANDAVVVPALDGGYALLGLSARAGTVPELLFSGMTWSTATVMAETRQRLQRLGLRWVELDAVSDIDEAADLAHLPAGWLA